MSESTREWLDSVSKVLIRCLAFCVGLLVIWLAAILFMRDMIHTVHGGMFGLLDHELDLILYCGMGLLKLLAITFFLIPWLAIRHVLKAQV